MRGDFSRLRFGRNKHYTSVLEQQGRVALDADWNEQRGIDEVLRSSEAIDVIGPFGGPENNAGFGISISGNTIQIGAGRYYVHGLACESPTTLGYENQPYLINPAIADSDLLSELSAGTITSIRLFLEVWQRMVTSLDDPCLREPALGQADTTTRLQTVWRVVAERTLALKPRPIFVPGNLTLLARTQTLSSASLSFAGVPLPAAGITVNPVIGTPVSTPAPLPPPVQIDTISCCQEMYLPPAAVTHGKMTAQTTGGSSDCSCQPTPQAGYRGLENQLYRVEVHLSGAGTNATFKWSRENGSVAAAVTAVGGADVVVDSLGPDANLGFQAGQWVELIDDTYVFGPTSNQPGELFQIKTVTAESRTITMTSAVSKIDPTRNARIRRWEQSGTLATPNGVAMNLGTWLDLENGVQIQFADGQFQSGDYWLIPARTATGQIEWPPCGSDGAALQPPHSIEIIRAPLACVHFANQQFTVEDCRRFFPPLTDLTAGGVSSLHVSKINWNNDDIVTFDKLLATGLTVSLDQAPTSRIDSSIFSLTLEPPVISQIEPIAVSESLTPIVLRTANPLDGQITITGSDVNWNLPFRDSKGTLSDIQLAALLVLNAMLVQGINYSSYTRVRVKLRGSSVFAGSGSSLAYLDGEALGTPGVRADGATPRMDLSFPTGTGHKASDFESWFFLAPTLLPMSLTLSPSAIITFSPTAPTPTPPVATLTFNYPALVDTVVTLSVISPAGITPAVTVPATVTLPKGKASVTFTVGVRNTSTSTPETFEIVASLTNALGLTEGQSDNLLITGFAVIGLVP